MNDILEKLKTTKILGIIGYALIIIGLFLPFISMPSQVSNIVSAMGIPTSFIASGAGVIMLIASIASLAVIFSDKIPALEKFSNQKITLAPLAVIAIIIISNISNASSVMALGASVGIGLGIGVWVCIAGIVVAAVYPFLYKGE